MGTKIKCPHCNKEFEPTDAWKHEVEQEIGKSLEEQYSKQLDQAKDQAVKEASKRLTSELDEERIRNKKLGTQLEELLEETRKLRVKDEEREIEMKRKLLDEEDKIRREVKKKAEEEHELKDLEKEKVIQDLKKSLEEMKRKAEQGSQQSQGEVLELSLESKLKFEFPTDKISEVKKGIRGADIIQEVFDKLGRNCGIILWESKNAQWSDSWIQKLKDDQRAAKADISVLVSVNLPPNVNSFIYKDGVWICSWKHFLPLSWTLRYNLVSIYHERQSNVGKDEKMQLLFQYLTGKEFVHRVEAIVESFSFLQEELEKEKRYFNTKWSRQEKEIRKVIDNTHGMWGDLQGVIGKSLPEIKTLQLDDNSELNTDQLRIEDSSYIKNT